MMIRGVRRSWQVLKGEVSGRRPRRMSVGELLARVECDARETRERRSEGRGNFKVEGGSIYLSPRGPPRVGGIRPGEHLTTSETPLRGASMQVGLAYGRTGEYGIRCSQREPPDANSRILHSGRLLPLTQSLGREEPPRAHHRASCSTSPSPRDHVALPMQTGTRSGDEVCSL